jgi:O-methyltransferase
VKLRKKDPIWRMQNGILERLARRTGRILYKPHLLWILDPSWREPYERDLQGDARRRKGVTRILDRRFTLVQLCRSVLPLRGSTAECGVNSAVGSALICRTLAPSYREGELHLGFDSFEGLPPPGERDRSRVLGHWWSKGELAVTKQDAEKRVAEFPFCELVSGWIPQVLKRAEGLPFRFVHVDVDLYESTLGSLEFFYPLLVPGGVLLLDDHGLASCPGARAAAEEFFARQSDPLIELATGQAFAIKGSRPATA